MACEMKCPACNGEFLQESGAMVGLRSCMMCNGYGVVMAEFRRLSDEELEKSTMARQMAARVDFFRQTAFVDGDPILGLRKF